MIQLDAGVAILGAGFGGSLCALIAERCGLRPVLIERGTHPRFALGESSTPVADLVLGELADRYELPWLKPLTHYGTWLRTYPQVRRGLKRGFSYFQHVAGSPFAPDAEHRNELLVAANPDAENGDTHWLREDFDHFLVGEVRAEGIPYFDHTRIATIESGPRWRLDGVRDGEPTCISADFLIDATGDGGLLAAHLGIATDVASLRTDSRALFGHFNGVGRWEDVYRRLGGRVADHPFPCDQAAMHHVFEGGWMWVLRFDHGVTSAGFCLDRRRYPADDTLSAGDEWNGWLRRFPSIAEQFAAAEPAFPLRRIDRVQRRWARAAGPNWAMLPTTAGIIDALHSTGNAHTLTGIERLMRILAESRPGDTRAARLAAYSQSVVTEVGLIDRMVHGCYASFTAFDVMAAYAMLYFAAATFTEHRRREGRATPDDGFLLSHNTEFVRCVAQGHADVCVAVARVGDRACGASLMAEMARRMAPYNHVGLCDASKLNMYPFAR